MCGLLVAICCCSGHVDTQQLYTARYKIGFIAGRVEAEGQRGASELSLPRSQTAGCMAS